MTGNVESTDRSSTEYFLFGLGFLGLLVGYWGILLFSPFLGISGAVITLVAVCALTLNRRGTD